MADEVSVLVPEGVAAGDTVTFRTPEGLSLTAVVPEGVVEGETFIVRVAPAWLDEILQALTLDRFVQILDGFIESNCDTFMLAGGGSGAPNHVGSDAFSDACPLSTAATDEQEWTRGRLAHKLLEGVAHGLLIAPQPVSVQHAGDNVPSHARPVAPPGLGRLVSVLTPVGDHHGIDETAPGIEYQFWDDDPSCSSTSVRYPSTQQVAGSSTDASPAAVVEPSTTAPSHLSDLERRKGKERQRRQAAREEHVRSYQAVDQTTR
jgi:hypothetical protein